MACAAIRADAPEEAESPPLVPLPRAVPDPKENPATPAKVALGKQLFFDPRLSGDDAMSCATCHLPEKGLADGRPHGVGRKEKPLARNTPGLWNVGFHASFFWDGRAATLEQQALAPIESPEEMNQDLDELERELNAVPGYARQFREVFGTAATREGTARALAAFERTLVAGPSPFDRYLAGEEQALSAEARRGLELFRGEAGCVRCHRGPLLSDGKFYRVGAGFRDAGRGGVTGKKEDRFAFRTPSLRNVAETAPYMHDGSRETLTEVVTFYFREVPAAAPDGLPLDVDPLLGQSFSDIAAVVAFLESLTGETPRIDPPRLPE
ncbi:MAG: cytochrome c peroxidase [Planctomycetales bacterium]